MLPPGFKWAPRWEHDPHPNGLFLDGQIVAYVDRKVDGSWMARLGCHWPLEAPMVLRDCQSMESGRRGCEIWAARHEARLRREVAELLARRRPSRGAG